MFYFTFKMYELSYYIFKINTLIRLLKSNKGACFSAVAVIFPGTLSPISIPFWAVISQVKHGWDYKCLGGRFLGYW